MCVCVCVCMCVYVVTWQTSSLGWKAGCRSEGLWQWSAQLVVFRLCLSCTVCGMNTVRQVRAIRGVVMYTPFPHGQTVWYKMFLALCQREREEKRGAFPQTSPPLSCLICLSVFNNFLSHFLSLPLVLSVSFSLSLSLGMKCLTQLWREFYQADSFAPVLFVMVPLSTVVCVCVYVYVCACVRAFE